jgi:hypothetical protein
VDGRRLNRLPSASICKAVDEPLVASRLNPRAESGKLRHRVERVGKIS